MIIDGRGENPSNIFDIDYREMCQIRETVVKTQLLGICIPVPAGPVGPAFSAEVVSWSAARTPPFHTRRGSGWREFHKLPQIKEDKLRGSRQSWVEKISFEFVRWLTFSYAA